MVSYRSYWAYVLLGILQARRRRRRARRDAAAAPPPPPRSPAARRPGEEPNLK